MAHLKALRTFLPLALALLGIALARPVPAAAQEYTLGAGDVLTIAVWGHADLSKDYTVDSDGAVPFPLVGRVKASGLTSREFAARLRGLLEKDYLVDPQVIVALKEHLSKKVHVLGEAERPGLFYLKGPTPLLEILSRAGGLSKAAGKQLILIRHVRRAEGEQATGSTILRFNLAKIQAGEGKENVLLEDEDTIFIPKEQTFFVFGEVKNAGTFPLNKRTSVLEALTIAGGFNEKAAPAGVTLIRRHLDGTEETLALDLSGPFPKDRDFEMREGDTVLVPKGNTFFVFGEVKKPGAYQLDKETNVLEGITIAGGFTDKAAPGRTRVIRSTRNGQEIVEIDMNDVIKRGRRDKAIPLRENDVVVVPESFF